MVYDVLMEGIVIKELLINENDKLLTIITAEYGKKTVLAKGIKAINSRRAAGANLFCHSNFYFEKKDERLWLQEIEVKNSFQELSTDYRALALASYFCDVANEVCVEDNDETDMFRLLLNGIYALIHFQNKPRWIIKAAFEMKTMCIQGFAPNFDSCVNCGVYLTELHKNNLFELLQGGFVCNKCSSQKDFFVSNNGRVINTPVYEAIKYICGAPQSKMLAYSLSEKYANEFSTVCEQYLVVHLEKRFKTLDYYNNAFKSDKTV